MAMNGKALGRAIADLIIAPNAPDDIKAKINKQWEDIGEVFVKHIQENIEVTVPASSVVVAVTGQATGTKNTSPIKTDVK